MDLLDEGSDEETVYHQEIDEDDLLGGSDEDEGVVHPTNASTRKPIVYSSHGNGNYEEENPESEDEDVLDITLGDIDELELVPQSLERKSNAKPVRMVKYAGAGSQAYVQLPPSDFSNFEHSQIHFSEDHKGGRSEQNNNAVGKPIQTLGQQRTVHNFQSAPGLRHRNPNQPQMRRMGGRNFNHQNPNHFLPHQPRNFYPRPRLGQGHRPDPSILGNGPMNFGEVRPGMIRHGPPVFPFPDQQQIQFKTIPVHPQMQQQFPHNNLNHGGPPGPPLVNQVQVRQMGVRNFNHPNPQPRHFYPRPEQGQGPDPGILGRGPPMPPNHVGHVHGPPQMFSFPDQQQQLQQQQMGPPQPQAPLLPVPMHLQQMHQIPHNLNPGPPPQPQQQPFGFGGPPIQMQNWNMNMNMGHPPNNLPPPQGQYFQPSYPEFVPQMYPQQQQQQQQQQLQSLQQQNMFIPNRQNQESFYQTQTMGPPAPSPSVQYNNMNMPIQNGHLHGQSQSHASRDQYDRDRDREDARERDRDREYDREREGRYNSEYKLSAGKRKPEYTRDEYSSGSPEKRVQSRLGPPVRTRRVESKEDQIVKIMLQTKKEMGLEVDKAYLQKLEEQKQKRAEVLRLKEERRKMASSTGVESKAAGTEQATTTGLRLRVTKVEPVPSNNSNSNEAGPSRSGGAGTGAGATAHSIHINPLAFKGDLTLLNNNLKKINMNVSSASSASTTTSTSTGTGGESSRSQLSQQQPGPSEQLKRQVTISTSGSVGGNSERPRKILRIVKNKNGEVISKSKVIVMRKQNQD